jgi:Rne/Rng family ribonuclease
MMTGSSATRTEEGAIINADLTPSFPNEGNSQNHSTTEQGIAAPDTAAGGGGAGGEGEKKKPRRRGSRGGRGRATGATSAAGGTGGAAKPRTRAPKKKPAARAVTPEMQPPVEAAPAETAPLFAKPAAPEVAETRAEIHEGPAGQAPAESAAEQPRPGAERGVSPAPNGGAAGAAESGPTTPAAPTGPLGTAFTPGPPMVGMRPATIRPAPAMRMSFSKGTMRHQFRPSGMGFKPPRPFLPPGVGGTMTPPTSGPADEAGGEPHTSQSYRALPPDQQPQHPQPPHPQQQHPQQQHPPQHAAHQGPGQPRHPQQQGQRGGRGGPQPQQQRHPQQGQAQQGHGQHAPQPQHPQQGHAQGQQGLPAQRGQQQGGQRRGPQQQGGSPPHPQGQRGGQQGGPRQGQGQLRPIQGGPPLNRVQPGAGEMAMPLPVAETPPELQPLPPQVIAEGGFAAPNGHGPAMTAPTTAESAALASFAEDIEIEEAPQAPVKRREPTGRDMLINVVEGEEVRIAIARRGVLGELYMERSSTESHVGNIYKGRVTNVEPSIQAAFIDFGIGKNGFLHISDLHPQYFPKNKQPNRGQGFGGPHPQQRRQQVAPPPRPAPSSGRAPVMFVPVAPAMPPDAMAAREERPGTGPGFEAPQQAGENGGMSQGDAPGGRGEIEHRVREDRPEMSMEMSPSEVGAPLGGAGRTANESVAGSSAATTDGRTDAARGADSDADHEEHGPGASADRGPDERDDRHDEEMDSGEAASEAAPSSEDAVDFGSAYNADLGDEFGDDSEGIDDGHMKPMEKVGRKTPRHDRPPIQQCLRRGQEVIVQVIKEGIGTKGPTLTSYISCPGRYLVMMPGMAQLGVSRKIEDLEQRRELKRTLQELNPPKNLGFIIRTAGTDVSKKELQGDLSYLVRMWKVIANRIRTQKAPVELYEESDLVIRTIRDVFNDEIDRIIVDNEQVASRIRDFLSIVNPRSAAAVELYTGTMPLYQKFGVEREIEKINSRRVEMANGGSLVIDSTEALVAIDVNSGRYREQKDAELTAFNMNKEAVREVCRQLRLRDLGGVIVIDFIDMRDPRHIREIERLLRDEMKNDRAKTKVLRMSLFCMIEMTRQRVRPSMKRSLYMDCPHCHGTALIKTPESVALDVMRRLAAGATRMDVSRIDVRAYPTVATFLLNRKRKSLTDLEEKTGKRINISPDETVAGDQVVFEPFSATGSLINLVL